MIKKQTKILLFSDIHGDFLAIKKLKQKAKSVDFCICAGDITNFSKDIERVVKELNSFKKPIFFVPGNHEDESEVFEIANRLFKSPNIVSVNNKLLEYNDFIIIGSEVNGFSREDERFELFTKLVTKELKNKKYHDKKIILVTHAPPYNTKLDPVSPGYHVGSKSVLDTIKILKPIIAVSGHIHEPAGATQKIGKTLAVNAGWNGIVVKV